MKTVLMTGASGFIGCHFLKYLKMKYKDARIILITSKSIKGFTCVTRGVDEYSKAFLDKGIDEINEVVMIGAFAPSNLAEENSIQGACSNLSEVEKILYSLPSIPQKILYCSTTGVYDENADIISERSQINPHNLYTLSKFFCEKIIEEYSREHGCECRIARFGSVYGPGEREDRQSLIQTFVRRAIDKEAITVLDNGMGQRNYVYVCDVCRWLFEYLTLKEAPGIINFASDTSFTIKQILEYLDEISQNDLILKFISDPSVSKRNSSYDNSLRISFLGDEETDFKEGLRNVYNYMLR